MSCDILYCSEWDTATTQFYTTIGFGRDVVALYQSPVNSTAVDKTRTIDVNQNIECFDYAPSQRGLVLTGLATGEIHTHNLLISEAGTRSSVFAPKNPRPCNSLNINANNLIAMGLERVRNEDSLQIWDLQQESWTPLIGLLPNEAVSSLKFLPQKPSELLCASYKAVREVDTRTSGAVVQHIPTKYSYGLRVSSLDENSFLSFSESGTLAVWDRRRLQVSGTGAPDPLLVVPRVFTDARGKSPKSVQFNPLNSSEFGVLHDGEVIRRWQTSVMIQTPQETPRSALSSAVKSAPDKQQFQKPENAGPTRSMFVDRVVDVRTEFDKVVAFDYVPTTLSQQSIDFVCIRQSGQVFRMNVLNHIDSLDFTPQNDLVALDMDRIWTFEAENDRPQRPALETRLTSQDLLEYSMDYRNLDDVLTPHREEPPGFTTSRHQSAAEESINDDLYSYSELLSRDIDHIMLTRARQGYSCDCAANIKAVDSPNTGETTLLSAWKWINNSEKASKGNLTSTSQVDVSFGGVTTLWEGLEAFRDQKRFAEESITQKEYDSSIKRITEKYDATVFVSKECSEDRWYYRQLCLRSCGWNFELGNLEEKLNDLEEKGLHEKAAGWAVFHGDVPRAVQSLAASRKSQLRLMSSAVAGYLVYKDVDYNNPWREQCRKLASEMSIPYLRAIFAYIADGSWLDVLDDSSLPLTERLGIALRFLPSKELNRYLTRLTDQAIKGGDLEGIILTGLTPRLVDLLQCYVDKTADVQTASLIAAFGSPRFFNDPRIDEWINSYRKILNQWKLFTVRAIFDVSRNKLSKSRYRNRDTPPIPKQVFLRCLHCREILGSSKKVRSKRPNAEFSGKCPNCNYPLPKCGICLLSLGPPSASSQEEAIVDRWPTFCMTCNHGFHSNHARQWFAKYDKCPISGCNCLCGKH